jgi:hypothetical protein
MAVRYWPFAGDALPSFGRRLLKVFQILRTEAVAGLPFPN